MKVNDLFKTYKLTYKNRKAQIYDPIREKYVSNIPEEEARQKTIIFLTDELKVPADRIIVEKSLSTLGIKGSKKRIDIGILDENDSLLAIIECKAWTINYNEEPYVQAQDYVDELHVKYFFVCDGIDFNGFCWNGMQFLQLDEIPRYDEW